MKPDKRIIPISLYKKIVDRMPIACVDVIVWYKGGVLLIKRSEAPNKGWWWFPGGRILKYESPEKAAVRLVKNESGLSSTVKKLVGVYTTNLKRWPGIYHFSVHVVYLVDAEGDIKIDRTSSDYRIAKGVEKGMHPYMKISLNDSGVFG